MPVFRVCFWKSEYSDQKLIDNFPDFLRWAKSFNRDGWIESYIGFFSAIYATRYHNSRGIYMIENGRITTTTRNDDSLPPGDFDDMNCWLEADRVDAVWQLYIAKETDEYYHLVNKKDAHERLQRHKNTIKHDKISIFD